MDIVLWGQVAEEANELLIGENVSITALIKESNRLVSTLSSKIEVSESKEKVGIVIGIDDSNGYPIDIVLESGENILVPEEVNFDVEAELPITIKFTVSKEKVIDFYCR
ncbi:uncharacterized protein [Antedon mediterranea]|uniref:uncharacterized protein n=1 Tax=Antedon mediterranea TaxID=105859 RepID=UPI003AF5A0EA